MQSIGISGKNLAKINKILFYFLWHNKNDNGKKVIERVKRDTVCSLVCEGGLNMIDIVKMQDSFLLKWADKLLENMAEPNEDIYSWNAIPILHFQPVGGTLVFCSSVNSACFKGFYLIESRFWKRVLKTWLDYKYCKEESLSYDINSPILNNTCVRFKKNPIFIGKCTEKKMLLIKDFIINGEIITFEMFCDIFGRNAETQFSYNIIFNALKRIENEIKTNLEQHIIENSAQTIMFKNIAEGGINRKVYYSMITQKSVVSV